MEASRYKRKRVVVSNPSVYLPNHIIDRIFTFLPTKDVISSSVVAKAFLNSWLYARNLHFDMIFHMNCCLTDSKETQIIDNIIKSHLGEKIYNFKLYIRDPSEYKEFLREWIELVAYKGLEELEIELFRSVYGSVYEISIDSINLKTLRSLKLISCNLSLSSNLKCFEFLKSLSLTNIQILPLLIRNLFTNCVVLESLALRNCYSTSDLTIKGSNKFRTLSIRGCGDINLITIDSENVTTFHYYGEIDKIKFVGPIITKDVILNLATTTWHQHISERQDLIDVLRNVHTLSINHIVLEGLSPKYVDFEYNDVEYYLPNLKELQIMINGSTFVNPLDVISFVKNCPQIERLFLDLGDYAMEAGSYWNSFAKEKFENCQIEFLQLKLLKVKDFKNFKLEEKLVNFFLLHVNSLESLIIVSKNNHPKVKSSSITTASKIAIISTYHYYTDKSDVFPKHRIY